MVARLRPFRVEGIVSSFVGSNPANTEFMMEDLAKSGLLPDDVLAIEDGVRLSHEALAGYTLPYFDTLGKPLVSPTGTLVMYRSRFRLPPHLKKEARYMQPNKEQLALSGLPPYVPYLLPYNKAFDNGTIYCVEGEKKTASVIKHLGVPAFGIAGCEMWRDPAGSGGVHPWILDYLRLHDVKRVRIIPDADVLRYDMARCYGTYAAVLKRAGFEVELLRPKGKIDDIIVSDAAVGESFLDGIPRIAGETTVQSSQFLAREYNLAFKQNDKGIATVYQHTSNITKLLEEHPAFPPIWRNLDTNRIFLGDAEAVPDLTEMEMANYFQHNLGFDKVNSRMLYQCIQALAKKNARSPMLEKIQGLQWDGEKRLDSWLQRLWGCPEDQYVSEVGAKWLISACARMDRPGVKVDWMFITIGPQATGKTSMPGIFYGQNYKILYGEQNDKDFHMLLHSGLSIGFDELDSFGKRESSTLKAMITRQTDAFRPPYGSSIEEFPRRFTLYGSGNRREFLQYDPSGYRRYGIVEVQRKLDFEGLKFERDQLWAEAWERYNFGNDEWWQITDITRAEDYVAPNLLEEQVWNAIVTQTRSKYSGNTQDQVEFTMSELMCWMGEGNHAKNTNVTREIAGILRKLGGDQKVRKVGGKTQRLWYITVSL